MDLVQKSIRVKNRERFKFDDWFIHELLNQPYEVGIDVMIQIQQNSHLLPEKDSWSQYVRGVVKGDSPFFFELEYLKQQGHYPIYLDIVEIDCDKYLDYINEKKILK